MKLIGDNMATIGCLFIVVLFIGFIWTDMGISIFSDRMLCDAIVTVVCFIFAEYLMSKNGVECGRLDERYIEKRKEYLGLLQRVREVGMERLDMFCDWQTDVEYEYYLRRKCRALKLDYKEYMDKYADMSLDELKRVLSADKAVKVFALNQINPIELTSEILMTDGEASKDRRGGVGISAGEYVRRKTVSWWRVCLTAVTCIISVLPSFAMNAEASWGLVMYTLFKLSFLAVRMYNGYSNGARAYNTVEVKHLEDKCKYLYLYIEFIETGKYSEIAERYAPKGGCEHENGGSNSEGGRAEDELAL